MAAIIDIYTGSKISSSPTRQGVDQPFGATLRVIPGGRSPAVIRMRRIYLFRRCLAAMVLLTLVAGAVVAGRGVVGATSSGTAPTTESVEPYLIHDGDTLWGVARSIFPNSDPRDVIDSIAAMNSTQGVTFDANLPLTPGQELLVPASI